MNNRETQKHKSSGTQCLEMSIEYLQAFASGMFRYDLWASVVGQTRRWHAEIHSHVLVEYVVLGIMMK